MIRAAVPGDDVALAALYVAMFREIMPSADLETEPSEETLGIVRAVIDSPEWLTLVAEEGDALQGFVLAQIATPPPPFVQHRYAHIYGFYLVPEQRNAALARALHNDVLSWARQAGAQWVDAKTGVNREVGRILYALGYQPMSVEMRRPL